jgi:hypothetical protein
MSSQTRIEADVLPSSGLVPRVGSALATRSTLGEAALDAATGTRTTSNAKASATRVKQAGKRMGYSCFPTLTLVV